MANYKLFLTNNINSDELYTTIDNVLNGKRTLFLTATQNLKRIRKSRYRNTNPFEIYTFSEFKQNIYDDVSKGEPFLSRADQKFVLNKVINSLFEGDRQRAFYRMRNELFELYEYLLSQEVGEISSNTIELIEKDFTKTEKDIFVIYNKYFNALYDIKSGIVPKDIQIDRIKVGKQICLLSESFNHFLLEKRNDYDTIVFDGFLFFNDEQKLLLESFISGGKDVIFIAKQMTADKENFLKKQLFQPLEEELDIKLKIIEINDKERKQSAAIDFVKNNYLNFYKTPKTEIDNGFIFIEPFTSRDMELNYIIKFISRFLKKKCNENRKLIEKMLAEDIAIVIAHDKEKYEQQINLILQEIGVFFLDKECQLLKELDCKNIKDVIYRKKDFVEAAIKRLNGKSLTTQEKLIAFKKLYKGINISQKKRSFINYPIGQYILEVYKIINYGMTCEGFKKILYSNWYYNVGIDTIKYDKYIKEFSYLETYLMRKRDISDWLDELERIKKDKINLSNKNEYRFHPLNKISEESLDFISVIIKDIKNIVENLSGIVGDINNHLKGLTQNFLLDEILENKEIANEFEIEIVKHLKEIVEGINKSNLVTNIDSKYFSDNIRNMLTDYERQKAESAADELTLNVVNLENMQNFDMVFFPLCEEDKYPRKYTLNFPFTENILEILTNVKYGIERKPNFIKSLDYHIKLEKFLFLNVLDFSTKELIFTQTEEENGEKLNNSIYIEDIFSMFNLDIKYKKISKEKTVLNNDYNPIKHIKLPFLDEKLLKLSDFVSYFLCPKIYYYLSNKKLDNEISYNSEWSLNIFIPSLIFYKTLYKLGIESKRTGRVYSLNDYSLIEDISTYLNESLKEEFRNFDFLNDYEKKDIKIRVEDLLNIFINKNLLEKGIAFVSFDITESRNCKIIDNKGKEINIVLDDFLRITDMTKNRSINYDICSVMDFLVRSSGGDTYDYSHFDEIFKQLNYKLSTDDRMALLHKLFFKLNVQLSGGFKLDGYERIRNMSNYIMSMQDNDTIASSYCKYCKFYPICKMKERGA